jgi:glucose-1-phosphate adenylyltransferase
MVLNKKSIKYMPKLEKNPRTKTSTIQFVDMSKVAAVILGGGRGSRLFPLTESRCKPALSFAGRFHLIDIPISNAINSGCTKIYVITQFLSTSLHQHIFKTYRHGICFNGFIEMLPVEEKPTKKNWFQGTADAIRQNVDYLSEIPADYFLILSGDQLYHMNFQHLLHFAQESDADLVIGAIPASKNDAKQMGILKVNANSFVTDFSEKPQDEILLKRLLSSQKTFSNFSLTCNKTHPYLGSMGIYLFKREVLFDLLNEDSREDFGKHLIPTMVKKGNTAAFLFQGYWEDIGTIKSFYNANMALTGPQPRLDCYSEKYPIYSDSSNLPAPKIYDAQITNSILCEGSIISAKSIYHSILGPRTIVKEGTRIQDSYIMGNDFYHSPMPKNNISEEFSIGENCLIKTCIIDKQVHIGNDVRLVNEDNLQHYDGKNIYIRDGIIVVPKGSSIPDGFIL